MKNYLLKVMDAPAIHALLSQTLKKYPFEFIVGLCLIIYTGFYCTPSSYGYVLSQLGMNKDGLYFSTPKPIRSDEWAVWTPYLQSLVTNEFERFNKFSIYHEDFRNFNSLPIYDWALIFKPQFWSFLVMEPARAFSFHHGFIIAAFLIGWKRFIQQLMGKHPYASEASFVFYSLLLFLSSFVQMWWTTLGPIMAFFPWLMIVLFSWKKHSIFYYLGLFYIATVWILAQTYPPVIISSAYLGLFLLIIYQPAAFKNTKRLLLTLVAFAFAIAISVFYLSDVIWTMMNTIYPGRRISMGGSVHWLQIVLPIFVPYQFYSETTGLLKGTNVCETSSVSSLLPMMALCFSNIQGINTAARRELKYLFFALLFFVSWMVLPVPAEWGVYLLLTSIPPNRMFFVFGLLVNLIALSLLLNCSIKVSWQRLVVFSVSLIIFWAMPGSKILPEWFIKTEWFSKSAQELLAIPLLIISMILIKHSLLDKQKVYVSLVSIAMLINGLYFAAFNPVQSARPIFEARNSPVLNPLRRQQQQHPRGWLISSEGPGAVLNGLGLKSLTHVLIQPQLDFFRKLFPELPAKELNQVFNRYAHIELYDVEKPYSPFPDVIRIPLKYPASQN